MNPLLMKLKVEKHYSLVGRADGIEPVASLKRLALRGDTSLEVASLGSSLEEVQQTPAVDNCCCLFTLSKNN